MPYLTPENVPSERICRSLLIPDSSEWLAIVSGAITELLKTWNWEEAEDGITVEEAIEVINQLVQDYYNEPCAAAGGARVFRLNVGFGGFWQQSDDGGETWTEPTGDATVPTREERTEPTADERRCLASANAANVLQQVYEEMIDAYNTDTSLAFGEAIFVALLAGLIGAWLGIIAAGAIAFAWAVFGQAWTVLEFLTADVWTNEFNSRMVCLLYNRATDDSGIVSFDYESFTNDLSLLLANADVNEGRLVLQLLFMLQFIGADGLNVAGQTNAIEDYDCAICGEVCDESLGGFGLNDWTPQLPSADPCSTGDLAYDSGNDRVIRNGACAAGGANGGFVDVAMKKEFAFDISRIEANYDLVNPGSVGAATFLQVWESNGTTLAYQSSINSVQGGTNRGIVAFISPPLPCGEYYVRFLAGNSTTSVASGSYAAINYIKVCGVLC